MSRKVYNLPPLTAITAFEAAARHLSFKLAAEELNVTPGAISHQIKALETELDLPLFDRRHRGVELTDAGDRLFRVVRGAFLDMSAMLDTLRGATQRNGVTVGATTAMSSLWLTPAISGFWRNWPDMRINQVVSDTLYFGQTTPDLVISYGPYPQPQFKGQPLFRDVLMPVCSPALAERHAPDTIEALAGMPLIHMDVPDTRWTGWRRWFEELGHKAPLRRGVTFNNYMIALQAAQDDVGMVLGWQRLVSPLLRSGALVAFDRFAIPAPTSFFLSRNLSIGDDPNVDALADWIRAAA